MQAKIDRPTNKSSTPFRVVKFLHILGFLTYSPVSTVAPSIPMLHRTSTRLSNLARRHLSSKLSRRLSRARARSLPNFIHDDDLGSTASSSPFSFISRTMSSPPTSSPVDWESILIFGTCTV